jgi:Kef-type K+ transport system membrane component KefB
LTEEALFFLAKLIGFGVLCFLFSRYLELRLTGVLRKLEHSPDPMVTVAGIGFMIAAVAGLIGFSLAIGAFFAGLVFSRDPVAVKNKASFLPLYDLFSPFFFIGIGLKIAPQALTSAFGMGILLLAAAVLAKILADGLPLWIMDGVGSGALIGVSMVPRAEIAMVIMQRGLMKGVVSPQAFGAMIVVCAATCTFSPMVVKSLLSRWPQKGDKR